MSIHFWLSNFLDLIDLAQCRWVWKEVDGVLLSDGSHPVVPAGLYVRDFLGVTDGLDMMGGVGRVWAE